ncbi:hypothetical protein HFD88_007568 [Aspergillus terreus]|nr:hypothetical protein HFD88_007568 [Aspergillus terreus]
MAPSLQGHIGSINTLELVEPNSLETVQLVWQEIVTEWFPGREGYRWSFRGPLPVNDNIPDVTVIQIQAITPDPLASREWDERQILLSNCKRPSKDTPTIWDDTVNAQFHDDLAQTLNASEKLFGAVAIGKKVRFYRFDGKALIHQQLVQLHQGTIDMANLSGVTQVEKMMNYIKANAWQWASTS